MANNPLDLFCLDFTKVDPRQDGKEIVLVSRVCILQLAVAVVKQNQKAQTVAKLLVDK